MQSKFIVSFQESKRWTLFPNFKLCTVFHHFSRKPLFKKLSWILYIACDNLLSTFPLTILQSVTFSLLIPEIGAPASLGEPVSSYAWDSYPQMVQCQQQSDYFLFIRKEDGIYTFLVCFYIHSGNIVGIIICKLKTK